MKKCENFLKDWNLGKHLSLIGAVYTLVYTMSNLVCFTVFARKKQKKVSTVRGFKPSAKIVRKNFVKNYVTNPPKAFKVMNTVITGMLCIDIASYPLVKKLLDNSDL